MNQILLNPVSDVDADGIVRAADRAGLREHTIFQTSGSSGEPKFVCLSQAALEASASAVNSHLNATAQDTWLLALPEFHVGGYAIRVRAHLSDSPVVTMSGKWSVNAFMERAVKATLTSLVPAQLFDLIEARQHCPDSLRTAIIGGGALSPALRDQALELGWPIHETYGMTEAGSQIACDGRVLPIWRTRIDSDGRLSISGSALFSGYISKSDFIPAAEWFETSDVVELNGVRLRFLGRVDDTVKVLGELVNIPSLESTLPADCAILAQAHPRLENELVLVCARSDGDPNEILRTFNLTQPGYARLQRFVEVDSIPRSPIGKIRRGELRKRALH